MRIAVLGTGDMGRTLGAGLIGAGHDVVFGSRDASRATGLPAPRSATSRPLPRESLADRVLIDKETP